MAEKYLNTPVTQAVTDMSGARGRIEDTPLVDAIQTVQLAYAKADVSLTALFNPRIRVRKGPVTVRQLAALYIYDNQLYAIEGTGRMLRDALEVSALYFRSCETSACSSGPLIGKSVHGFNFDMAQGVTYQIDLREPTGHRIKNLRWEGKRAQGRSAAAHRDQQLPGVAAAAATHVSRRQGGLAILRGHPRPDDSILRREASAARESRRQLAHRATRARQELLKEVDAETERAAER
jgi:2',3'-cyclic-nucleotide 2'-phosphodiesterase (5'-nucleotidase family)